LTVAAPARAYLTESARLVGTAAVHGSSPILSFTASRNRGLHPR